MSKKKTADTPQTEESRPDGPSPEQTNQVDVKLISLELNNALMEYLQAKPFIEVNGLVNSLSQSPVTTATITNGN